MPQEGSGISSSVPSAEMEGFCSKIVLTLERLAMARDSKMIRFASLTSSVRICEI